MAQGNSIYCTRCGAVGPLADVFCRQCGVNRSSALQDSPFSSHTVYPTSHQSEASPGIQAPRELGYPEPSPRTPPRVQQPEGQFTAPPPPSPGLLLGPLPYYGPGAASEPRPPGSQNRALVGRAGPRPAGIGGFTQPTRPLDLLPAAHRTLALSAGPAPGALTMPPALLSMAVHCPICGSPLMPGSDHCPHCDGAGRALVAANSCHHCGCGNPVTNRYCGRCGGLLVSNALASHRSSPSALPVLGSIVLPGLGQMMNGEITKGFMLLGAALLMISQPGATIFNPIYLLITLVAAVDAAVGRSRRRPGYRRLNAEG